MLVSLCFDLCHFTLVKIKIYNHIYVIYYNCCHCHFGSWKTPFFKIHSSDFLTKKKLVLCRTTIIGRTFSNAKFCDSFRHADKNEHFLSCPCEYAPNLIVYTRNDQKNFKHSKELKYTIQWPDNLIKKIILKIYNII